MKLPNTSILNTRGFTLLEILVVVAIFAIVASLGLAFSFQSYSGYLFRGQETTLIQTLMVARNLSANNFDESAHGVSFFENEYRLYAVNEYDEDDSDTYQSFPIGEGFEVDGPEEVIFEQLSGSLFSCDGNDPCEITMTGNGKTDVTTINQYGGIIW